jgi:hypothetical protein
MPRPNDARKVRGTIEGSINVDFLQRHHEFGRSVTNEGGVSLSAAPTCRRDGWPGTLTRSMAMAMRPIS